MNFQSEGTLRYSNDPYKLIVEADNQIALYYRSMIPKYLHVNGTRYPAHISVVRKEIPKNMQAWRKHAFKKVTFEYDGFVYNDDTYYWLNVYSPTLESIRVELGLPTVSGITYSPDGRHRFHMTIGNLKQQ